jgi:DNA modification methylase
LKDVSYGGAGSAARFFYVAKANKKDRDEGNNHPTVKPTDLMRYLVRLVTRKGGICLDPFMGSGSTGKACVSEGMIFYGMEKEKESFVTSVRRIRKARRLKKLGGLNQKQKQTSKQASKHKQTKTRKTKHERSRK